MALNAGNLEMTPVLCSTGQKADQTICELLFSPNTGAIAILTMDSTPPTPRWPSFVRTTNWVRFAKKRSLPLLLWRLPKSNAASATVLGDELGVDSLGHAADGLRR